MTPPQIIALLGTLASILAPAIATLLKGGVVDWEALAVSVLQAIFGAIPQSTFLALRAWLEETGDEALISIWNGMVRWSRLRVRWGQGEIGQPPDWFVEIPAPGFPVPGSSGGGQPPP